MWLKIRIIKYMEDIVRNKLTKIIISTIVIMKRKVLFLTSKKTSRPGIFEVRKP